MDALRAHDLELNRRTPPAEKLAQALDVMASGLRMKRANLRRAMPSATDEDIDAAFERWLLEND